jgi:anti-sigma regulatory factor (Ser/Thr protein kinase)
MQRTFSSPAESESFFISDYADLTLAISKLNQSSLFIKATDGDRSIVQTIISELGTNILKYAKRGVLKIGSYESLGVTFIEIHAEDQGPGIADIELAMKERFSTGNTLGLGLPGVKRMADEFLIKTSVGNGTSISVKKRIFVTSLLEISQPISDSSEVRQCAARTETFKSAYYELSYCVRALQGEVVSGDMATVIELTGGVLIALVDVTGHGLKASELANEIRILISHYATARIAELMTTLHERLKGTCGAAISLLYLDTLRSTLSYYGVGNTAACRVVGKDWHPISKDGVVGCRLPNLVEDRIELRNADVILVTTDGVAKREARQYVVENSAQPGSLIAQGLINKWGRPCDDAACIVLKWVG